MNNAFAAKYDYSKGTLPVLDDLVQRSSLLSIPPVLSPEAIDTIGAEFARAAQLGCPPANAPPWQARGALTL